MVTVSLDQVRSWCGRTVVDSGGAAIGTVVDVYLRADTQEPVWALVDVGQFGAGARAVPVVSATEVGDEITVSHPRAIVVAAPDVRPDETISVEDERELYRYYGLPSDATPSERPSEQPSDQPDAPSVVRSEEELQIGTQRRPSRTVRMKKEVVTDYVTQTVPVRREQLRLVEGPVTDDGTEPTAATEEPELTLHAEEPVIETRVVPKEKVRLRTDTVSADAEISEDVRTEQVELTRSDDSQTREQAGSREQPGSGG